MADLNPVHVQMVMEAINRGPFFRHLSMPVKELGKGYSLVELDIGNEHLNPFGGLHGGVYASAIDTAAYWAVYCELDEDVGLISLDLKVDYLAPASAGKLIVKGRSIKIGKTICLAEATAFDGHDKWLAHGISKMMVTQGLQTIKSALDFIGADPLPPKFV
ncbi:MAG TPA: PaaI family thioesterase [Thermodesulfobacteriota bacterium]|nr:PaaI family thioesterase [Thermodesulfobacteriota bacterium]